MDPYEKVLARLAGAPAPARAETVALVIPPSPQLPTPGREFLITGPFEGFTAIATVVKALGYRLKVVDCRLKDSPVEFALLRTKGADLIGIATYCDSFVFLENVTKAMRLAAPKTPIFLGGPLVSSLPGIILKHTAADCAMLGEAEMTLIELLETVFDKKKKDFLKIKGMAVKMPDCSVKLTAPRPQIQDLDHLPFPDYRVWPNYASIVRNGQIIISSTRGCPYSCTFCYKTIPALREKSLERFEREVAFLKKTTKFDYAWLNDLTFNIRNERAMRVSDILFKYGVKYHCFARVTGVTEALAKKLKETGCQGIWFGVESYDQKVLTKNRKNTTIAQINSAIKTASEAGLATRGLFIVGLPGETAGSLKGMLEFIQKGDFIPLVKYLVPFPGTAVYRDATASGKIADTPGFLRALSRRQVRDRDDEITNMTGMDEATIREYFHKIWELTREKDAA